MDTNTFPCATLPPPPPFQDIKASGSFLKESVKAIVRWWVKSGLFFAAPSASTFIPAGIKAIRDAATELEAEYSQHIP